MYEKIFYKQEEIFKVLANHKRLEIIQLLSGRELMVSEMVEMLGLPQANLSQHLKIMRAAGLVNSRRKAQTIYYKLKNEKVRELCELAKSVISESHTKAEDAKIEASLYPVVKDIVCGMRFSLAQAFSSAKIDNATYYFCASGCKESFLEYPEKYDIKLSKKELV